MITIKDFSIGDTVYILTRNFGKTKGPEIHESTVTAVGKKYITIGKNAWSRKFQNNDTNFLYENNQYGESGLLFKKSKREFSVIQLPR